ncbi:phosphate acetyltransferase [Desulfitispora alkaliphila]|uniref:phosphate acetyltransferase n=1 Tax=Desulfitispora alkaliphila TaxID=622674 RepID=UPI003D1A0761
MDLIQSIKEKAKSKKQKIVLPEGTEPRTVQAGQVIAEENLADAILLGNPEEIKKVAAETETDLTGVTVIDPNTSELIDELAETLYELRKHKGLSMPDAKKFAKNPLYFAALMVKVGKADGYVAGAENTTGDVLRPALQVIKTAENISTVSGAFVMVLPDQEYGSNGLLVVADCAVNPNPTAQQLAEIAYLSAGTAKSIAGIEPKVGMLSFSTMGSAKHELVEKVTTATAIAKERFSDLEVEGELQLDAAIVPSVAKKKAPDSTVAGSANVLVFPDLQAGNIGYKLIERIGKAKAIGPVLQGIAKPVNDLSRGCSVEDIINVTALTAVQAQNC